MSKWLKLMKQIETSQQTASVISPVMHQEEIYQTEPNDIFQAVLIVLMLLSAFLTIKSAATVQKSKQETVQMTQLLEDQKQKVSKLEAEISLLKQQDLTAINKTINDDNSQLDRLSLENAALRVRISELEFSEQQMISEMMALTKENAQENQLNDGRKI